MIIHPIRILLVDDHPVFRDGLQALFSLRENMQVIAATGTGEEAVRLASEHHPDVVLMDIQMPGVDGIEATRRIITANPAVHVIMLTMVEDDEAVFKAMQAGARGYLLKSASQNEVLGAVETVIGGQAVYSASIARRMMAYFADTKPASVLSASPDLTSVEKEILRLVARGYADEQAAVQLGMDPYDVQIHLTRVIEKLQVSDRAQAVERARQAGLEM